jgi:hypothetical protein
MKDEDIFAFTPAASAPAPVPPRRGWWQARGGLWLLLAVVLLAATAWATGHVVLAVLDDVGHDMGREIWREGVRISVDGETVHLSGGDTVASAAAVGLAVLMTLLVVALVVGLVVPLALLAAGVAVVVSLVLAGLAVGVAALLGLGAVTLVLALALSPLWGVALLLWWLLRRRRAPAHRAAASPTH